MAHGAARSTSSGTRNMTRTVRAARSLKLSIAIPFPENTYGASLARADSGLLPELSNQASPALAVQQGAGRNLARLVSTVPPNQGARSSGKVRRWESKPT